MSELIVKHNNFVEANYNLTLTELKIIAKLSSMIQKEDDDITCYKFSLQKLLEELNLGKENYTHLIDSLDRLLTRIIIIKRLDSNTFLKTTFLSSTEYFLDDSTVELSFDKKLKPYLLQLKNNFTMYQFQNVVALSSFYAIRIYELCKQYEKIKERIIEIKSLKEILDIKAKSYNRYDNFKRKVLNIAEREINEKTDITISFEEVKTSRKVTSIKFLIEKKEKQVKQIETSETKEKKYSEEVESLFCAIKKIEQVECLKDLIKTALKSYNFEYIKSNILYTNKNAKTNYNAYLQQAIENDYAKIDREKEEQKQKIQSENEKLKQDEVEKEEQNKQEIKELIECLTEQEKEKHYNEYLSDKYTLKEVVSFENYLIVKIDYDKNLKLELQKRNEVKPISPSV